MRRIIISGFFLLFHFAVFAQADYRSGFVVTHENDTLFGQLDYRSNFRNYQSCIFREGEDTFEYFPGQISGFGFVNDKYYSSGIIDSVFVEVLVSGQVNLYKHRDHFYVKKQDSDLYKLETKEKYVEINPNIYNRLIKKKGMVEDTKWIGVLNYLLSDCISVTRNLNGKALTEKNLSNLIVNYHDCLGLECIEFKQNKAWSKIDLSLSAGMLISYIRIQSQNGLYYYLHRNYRSYDPSIGAFLEFSSPRISEYLYFQSGIHYNRPSYTSLVIKEYLHAQHYYDTHINFSNVAVPVCLKYVFPGVSNLKFIQAGMTCNFVVNGDAKLTTEIVKDQVVTTYESPAFELNKMQLGLWGGIGLTKSFERFEGSLSLRYGGFTKLNNYNDFSARNNSINVSIILSKN